MTATIKIRFEVERDAPSEVHAQARQLVIDALLVHMRRDDISDDDEALIAEMLDVDSNPPDARLAAEPDAVKAAWALIDVTQDTIEAAELADDGDHPLYEPRENLKRALEAPDTDRSPA